MKKMTRSTRQLIISMLVLALLVMALPMTIVAKGRPADNPGLAKGQNKVDKQKPEGEEDEKSLQAQLVAARNDWAKGLGLPPGHANLMLKSVLALTELEPDSETYIDDIKGELNEFYLNQDNQTKFFVEGRLNVKAYMSWLKAEVLMLSETQDPDDKLDDEDEETQA